MREKFALKSTLIITWLSVSSCVATASSFQILEQSPAQLGKAFAGTASDITDASSVFFSPAGISQLEGKHLTVAGNVIMTQSKFFDQGSNIQGDTGKTEETGLVPNLYYVHPLNDRFTLGLGINAPFGLASDYGNQWTGRYLATYSELQVVNVNSTFAYEINEHFALGLGINYQRAEVTLESQVDSTLGINPAPATDSSAKIRGSDNTFVADASLFFRPSENTNIGLVWRQGGKFSLSGDAAFSLDASCKPGAGFPTGAPSAPTTGSICAGQLGILQGDVEAEVELPDTLTLSFSHQLNDQWTLHGDAAWTEWSSIQAIDVINTENNFNVDELELFYDDTLRYALGVTFNPEGAWAWRAGLALDQAPQTAADFVNPRIPDQDRTWLSLGFNYAVSSALSLDFAYAHIFVDDARIDNVNNELGHLVRGEFDAAVDIVGVQANWRF